MKNIGGLTHSRTEHLVAIAELQAARGYARVADVSRLLGITHGSASLTLKVLKEKGFVTQDDNRFLLLTEKGKSQATDDLEKRDLLYRLFRNVVCCPAEVAKRESAELAHALSNEAASHLASSLMRLEGSS